MVNLVIGNSRDVRVGKAIKLAEPKSLSDCTNSWDIYELSQLANNACIERPYLSPATYVEIFQCWADPYAPIHDQ